MLTNRRKLREVVQNLLAAKVLAKPRIVRKVRGREDVQSHLRAEIAKARTTRRRNPLTRKIPRGQGNNQRNLPKAKKRNLLWLPKFAPGLKGLSPEKGVSQKERKTM